MHLILLSLGIGISSLLTILGEYRSRPLLYVFKPLTTALIIAVAWETGKDSPDTYYWLILAGLVFSLAGDVFLMLPRDRFVPGLVSFLIAHLLYIAAFGQGVAFLAAPHFALPYVGAGIVLLAILLPKAGNMRIPVFAYSTVILVMAWQATSRWQVIGDEASFCAMLGAVMFLLSDSVLAINRFAKPFKAAEALLLSTYFTAQWLIALSV